MLLVNEVTAVYISVVMKMSSYQNNEQSNSKSRNDDQVSVPAKHTKHVMQKKHTNECNKQGTKTRHSFFLSVHIMAFPKK
jgi:hypothetical protein